MTRLFSSRDLTNSEIEIAIHLLKCGASMMPVRLLSKSNYVATELWRLGVVNIWHRQSPEIKRADGPFYSLTRNGAYRAESLALARRLPTAIDHPPPPPIRRER